MPGLYYEDFEVGQTFVTAARTVTESDIVTFAGLSGDFNSIHTNAEFAKTTPLGQRIAHAALGIAFVTGLTLSKTNPRSTHAVRRMPQGSRFGGGGAAAWRARCRKG